MEISTISWLLKHGTLAGSAWTGYLRIPKFGLYRTVEEVLGEAATADLLTAPWNRVEALSEPVRG